VEQPWQQEKLHLPLVLLVQLAASEAFHQFQEHRLEQVLP
jgi:hypothetical protein